MLLAARYGWIKWAPFVLVAALFAIVLGSELDLDNIYEHPVAASLAAALSIAVFASLAVWILGVTTLCCPKCKRWIGSRYDTGICRQCGHRLDERVDGAPGTQPARERHHHH
jgi:hypothetical protein